MYQGILYKKHTYRCRSARAFGCKPLFSWGLPLKIGVWWALWGAKLIPSDSPPSICYNALESSEYLKSPGCREHFSIFVGVFPPKLGFGGHLGRQMLYHRIARPQFAIISWNHLNISNRLAAVSVSPFSWGSALENCSFGGT